jgi:dipeptidase D
MESLIRKLQPISIWNHFSDLNAVPRPSKKEERIIEFMVNFGKKLMLETIVDGVGNVIIKKPATKGFENKKTVVMQSHLDMVHQKNSEIVFNFETQGINMFIDGDWVTADGTTLGADNGLGVAAIMAVLSSVTIEHPTIEALFTIDEETGMTGAMGLKGGLLSGEILLNLDTEEDDEIDMGCAGGIDVTANRNYQEETTPTDKLAFKIAIRGLQGGHSGMDIHKEFGNANKIMNRLLYHGTESVGLRISTIDGGSLRNAIPRESFSTIVINATEKDRFLLKMKDLIGLIKEEFNTKEPNLTIDITSSEIPLKIMDLKTQKVFLRCIYTTLNGVYRMSPHIANLVETSNNIARIVLGDGKIHVACLTRSSSESSKNDLTNALTSCFELGGFKVELSGAYPGWQPNVDSEILKVLTNLYENLFGKKARVEACHAGLECGILGQNYPLMDMISFGPTIKGAHSPDERVSITSVQKFWKFLLQILKNIPERNS